jgi:hypothetical protein
VAAAPSRKLPQALDVPGHDVLRDRRVDHLVLGHRQPCLHAVRQLETEHRRPLSLRTQVAVIDSGRAYQGNSRMTPRLVDARVVFTASCRP